MMFIAAEKQTSIVIQNQSYLEARNSGILDSFLRAEQISLGGMCISLFIHPQMNIWTDEFDHCR